MFPISELVPIPCQGAMAGKALVVHNDVLGVVNDTDWTHIDATVYCNSHGYTDGKLKVTN